MIIKCPKSHATNGSGSLGYLFGDSPSKTKVIYTTGERECPSFVLSFNKHPGHEAVDRTLDRLEAINHEGTGTKWVLSQNDGITELHCLIGKMSGCTR
jgi:hypothetical protein